jgi:hypothetical protein
MGRTKIIFNEIHYKVDCNVIKSIFNKCFSSYGYHKLL